MKIRKKIFSSFSVVFDKELSEIKNEVAEKIRQLSDADYHASKANFEKVLTEKHKEITALSLRVKNYEANVAYAIAATKDVHDMLLKGSTSLITKKSIELMPGDEYERRFKTELGFREAVDKALGAR